MAYGINTAKRGVDRLRSHGDSISTKGWVGFSLLSSLVLTGSWQQTEYPAEPVLEGVVTDVLKEIKLPSPFDEELRIATGVSGEMSIPENMGQFVVYSNISTETTQEIFGVETDSVDIDREAFFVTRMRMPSMAVVDTVATTDGQLYITLYDNSGNDVGVNVEDIQANMLRPLTAKLVGGEPRCPSRPGLNDYTGCILDVDFDDNFLSRIPGPGANSDWSAQDMSMNVATEFGNIFDPCFLEQVFIPEMNAVYESSGMSYRIDGPDQVDISGKTLIRYLYRSTVSPGFTADDVPVNLVGTFRAVAPLHERIETVITEMGGADTVVDLDEGQDRDFCVRRGANYGGEILRMYRYGEEVDNMWEKIALGGMEFPPENFDISTGTILESSGVEK